MPDFKPWQWVVLLALLATVNIVVLGGLGILILTYDIWASPQVMISHNHTSVTPTPKATLRPTFTPTWTPQVQPTPTSTRTPTPAPPPTATWTPLPTHTLSPLFATSPAAMSTITHTPSPTSTYTPTRTPVPTRTPLPTWTPLPIVSSIDLIAVALPPAASDTPAPTATLTASPTTAETPAPTLTPTASSTVTETPTPTPTATPTASPTITETPAPTLTPTASPTATETPTPTATPTLVRATLVDNRTEIVQARPLGMGAFMLSWQPMHRAEAYRLHSDMGSGLGIYVLRAEAEENSYIDTYLRPATSYRYQVIALDHDEEMLLAHLTVTTPPQPTSVSIGSRMLMTLPTPTRTAITVTPAPTPLPPDTIILGLLSASDHVDEIDGRLIIVGEVRNDSNMSVGDAVVSVVLYDAQGERQGEIEGKPVLSTLAPGERSPFIIKGKQPASEMHYSVRATARARSDLHIRSASELSVSSSRRFEDDIGLYHIAGVVKNKGTQYAEQVRVVVILYDRGDRVINVGFGYPKPGALASGESANFDVTFTYYPKVVRHAVLVLAD